MSPEAPLRRHAPFLLLLVAAVPAVLHFTSSATVSSMGDDSIAYLMLARFMAHPADALITEWIAYQGHFPPLFPALLALTGAAWNLAIAHGIVAAFAILAIVMLYRFASLVLGGHGAGLLVAALFLLTPTAWISIRGILSESMFLFITLWALHWHEARLREAQAPAWQWLVLGLLLGSAFLVRAAGLPLILAYAVHVLVAAVRTRRRNPGRQLLAFLPVAAMAAAWILWRPHAQGYNYDNVIATVMHNLATAPIDFFRKCLDHTLGGWVRSFAADSAVHWTAKAVFAAVGILGVAGALLRAWRNHVDGWYVLATLPIIFLWLFPDDNTRRLFYPLVPLMILHAAVFVVHVAARLPEQRHRRMLVAAVVALPALLCVPAWVVVQSKSLDRERILPEFAYRYSDITDYYTTLGAERSREVATRHAKVLSGLESLRVVTLPGARVMWVRPDYIVVLGDRGGVPWYYRWDALETARQIKRSKVEFLVISTLLKSDMDGVPVDLGVRFEWALALGEVVFSELNARRDGYDMAVLKVDPAAVERLLAGR